MSVLGPQATWDQTSGVGGRESEVFDDPSSYSGGLGRSARPGDLARLRPLLAFAAGAVADTPCLPDARRPQARRPRPPFLGGRVGEYDDRGCSSPLRILPPRGLPLRRRERGVTHRSGSGARAPCAALCSSSRRLAQPSRSTPQRPSRTAQRGPCSRFAWPPHRSGASGCSTTSVTGSHLLAGSGIPVSRRETPAVGGILRTR